MYILVTPMYINLNLNTKKNQTYANMSDFQYITIKLSRYFEFIRAQVTVINDYDATLWVRLFTSQDYVVG